MPSSLIPEKTLSISPSLAATIGLEEAVMLQGLHERCFYEKPVVRDGYRWHRLSRASLEELFPFWQPGDMQRVASSLKDKGVLVLADEPLLAAGKLEYALNERVVTAVDQAVVRSPSKEVPANPAGAGTMTTEWRPDSEILKQITRLGIPERFAFEQLPEFVSYWRDRNEAHHGWGNKFLKQVVRRWREEETVFASRQRETGLEDNWAPSEDALEILERAGISLAFIEDAVPEFVLYWRERGDNSSAWNSKFVQHIKRQWARYQQTLSHDTEPRTIPENWQPSNDVYDVLTLANIDLDFARGLLPEFMIFWRDSGQMHSSWNSKFLQHVKYHWARRHQLNKQGGKDNVGFIERHTDRSWARGL
jgi:hypothetical protein